MRVFIWNTLTSEVRPDAVLVEQFVVDGVFVLSNNIAKGGVFMWGIPKSV